MSRHAIGLAIDLARMPALARTSVVPPIPPDVIDLMRVAAGSRKACQEAAAASGESVEVVIAAARFYLQQSLFRPDADCYRILGIQPWTKRTTAREHMRWLLTWLHPDHNRDLESVYAERVVRAWRQVSASHDIEVKPNPLKASARKGKSRPISFRLPWIEHPTKRRDMQVEWAAAVGFVFVFITLASAAYYFGAIDIIDKHTMNAHDETSVR